jgi:hypothetical protein
MSLPAGAALGTTEDAKTLVVGEPSSLEAAAEALRSEAATMRDVSGDLATVRIPSWAGRASDAFWGRFDSEPRVWADLHDLMTRAATAMAQQAQALRTAQDKARDAIDTWTAGEAATRSAARAYDAEAARRARAAPLPGLTLPMPPFHDPGQAMREEAQQILDDARTALDQDGLDVTARLCGLGDIGWSDATGDLSGPGAHASAEGPDLSFGNDRNIYDERAPWQKGYADGDHDSKAEISLGSVAAEAYVARLAGDVTGNHHGIDYSAGGDVTALEARASATAALTDNSIKGRASAHAELLSAHGEASAEYGYGRVRAEAGGSLGANADVGAEISTTGVHAGGEAFVGGKIEGSVGGDVGGVGGGLEAEGWAGAGIAADADVGFRDGEFTIGGSFGAGFGVGGRVGGEITVDPAEVLATSEDIIGGIADLLD